MCGIAFCKSFNGKPVNRKIRKLYHEQKDRGTEGFGFVAVMDGKAVLNRAKYEHQIMRTLKYVESDEVLFHHRWPTSTANTVQTAHPIAAKADKLYKHNYYLVHNGCIMNDGAAKSAHEEFGIEYATEHKQKVVSKDNPDVVYDVKMFNDSECLLHELALILEGHKKIDDFRVFGSIAFILMQTDKNDKPIALYYGRNSGSPLNLLHVPDVELIISSEGEGWPVDINTLFRYDYETGSTSSMKMIMSEPDYSKYFMTDTAVTNDDDMPSIEDEDDEAFGVQRLESAELQALDLELRNNINMKLVELADAQMIDDDDEEALVAGHLAYLERYREAVKREIERREHEREHVREVVRKQFDGKSAAGN